MSDNYPSGAHQFQFNQQQGVQQIHPSQVNTSSHQSQYIQQYHQPQPSSSSEPGPSNPGLFGGQISIPPPSPVNGSQEILVNRADDWTASLVKLAKSAELKKHSLTLQLHTTRIMSHNATLQKKTKSLGDIQNQRTRLEEQRTSLLSKLREINESREKVDLEESKALRECDDIRTAIQQLTDGDYAIAKMEVDKLRQELGMEEAPPLQVQLDQKSSKKRTGAAEDPTSPDTPQKRGPGRPPKLRPDGTEDGRGPAKRPRGRPKGSKNKPKEPDSSGEAPLDAPNL